MNAKNSILARLDSFSLCALVVAMCSQIDVRHLGRDTLQEGLGYATKTLSLALSDVVFVLVFLWFIVRCVQTRAWKKLWWPPLPCWALIFALVLAAVHSPSINEAVQTSVGKETGLKNKIKAVLMTKKEVVKNGKTKIEKEAVKESKEALAEIVQFVGYFLVAPWLFVNLIHDRRGLEFVSRRRLGVISFAVAVCVTVFVASIQLFRFESDLPRAFFGSPNVYSAFVCFSIPLFAAHLVCPAPEKGRALQLCIGLALLLMLFFSATVETMVSFWAFAALMFGVCAALVFRLRYNPTYIGKPRTGFFLPASNSCWFCNLARHKGTFSTCPRRLSPSFLRA